MCYDRNPSNLWESPSSLLVHYMLTPKVHHSTLGREIGGIQRPIYSFLQRIHPHTSFDTQLYIVQHLPNDSNLQAQVRIPCQDNTAVISSTVPKSLCFSTYLLLPSPLLPLSSTWKVCHFSGVLTHFLLTLFFIFGKKIHWCLSSYIIYQ